MFSKFRIYFSQKNSLALATILVAGSSFLSRILGVARDRILAQEFGAGDQLDAYYAAFRVPDTLFNLIVLGALSAGFIPIFTKLLQSGIKEKKQEEAWYFVNNLLSILLLVLIIFCGLGIVFAPFLTLCSVPGFTSEKQMLTTELTRIMFLSPLLLGISGVLGGILQSFKQFFVFSLAPIVYNLGIIFGALVLVPLIGLKGLALGVILGAFLHLFIQIPSCFKLGFRYRWILDWENKPLQRIGKMTINRIMSLGVSQLNLFVITIIASTSSAGALSAFNLANNLQYFPVGIFGISLAVASFPTLAESFENQERLIAVFSKTLKRILFFVVPSMVLFLTLRAQIVRVVLGIGQFDWEDTIITMNSLAFFSLSLFAQALLPLLARMFFIFEDSRTPFFVGLFSAFCNVLLSYYLNLKLGPSGLALAFSFSSLINFFLLWVILHHRLCFLDEKKILISAIKFSLAAILAGGAIQTVKVFLGYWVEMDTFLGVFLQLIGASFSGILIYLMVLFFLKSEEVYQFFNKKI